jgi:hypothetical protein
MGLKKQNIMGNYNVVLYTIIMLFYIIGASSFTILSLIGFIFTIYIVLRSHKQQVVEIMLLLSSFAGIMKIISPFSLYNFLLVFAITRMLWIDKGRVNSRCIHFCLVVILVSTIGLFFAGTDTTLKMLSFLAGVVFVGLVISNAYEYDILAIIRAFAFGVIVSSIVFLAIDFMPGITKYITFETYRVSAGIRHIRFSGLLNNPNHYTLSVNIACMALMSYLIVRKTKVIDIVFFLLLLLFGIYSLSKSFVFGFMASVIMSLIYLLRHNPGRWLKLTVTGFIICIVAFQFIDNKIIDILINRILINDVIDFNTYTTGRVGIFKMYFDYIIENIRVLFIGNGLFNPLDRDSHNFFIELIYSFGIVGTSIVIFSYFRLSRAGWKVKKHNKKSILNYAPLLVFLIRGMAVNIILSTMFPAYLIVITLIVGENLSSENKNTRKCLTT